MGGVKYVALPLGLLGVSLIAFLAACGDDDEGGPSVEIADIQDGEEIEGPDVQVCVDVENFEVVDRLGEAEDPGEGHVHFYIDQETIPIDHDEPAVTEEGTYHATAEECHTWEELTEGEHSFTVQLVDNDHTALDDPRLDEVDVLVTLEPSPTPSPSPTRSPTPTPAPTEEEEEETPEEQTVTLAPTESPSPSPTLAPTASPTP